MSGLYTVVLDEHGNSTDRKIVNWTRNHGRNPQDTDNIVAVDFNLGGYIRFSNSLEGRVSYNDPASPITISAVWDPPGDPAPPRGYSQHTAFDDQPLSKRDEGYRETAVNWFVEFVLDNYLSFRALYLDPIPEVMAALSGRTPQTVAEVTDLLCRNPALIDHIQLIGQTFVPEQVSPAVRQLTADILEDRRQLMTYLDQPEGYVAQRGTELSDLEKRAFIRAARDKRDLIGHAFDCVELGRGRGDGNLYVLIGWAADGQLPHEGGVAWFWSQLPQFVADNQFVPGFGWYITEARMRYHIILGPGVTDREREFLRFFGHHIIDRRDGQEIGDWLAVG